MEGVHFVEEGAGRRLVKPFVGLLWGGAGSGKTASGLRLLRGLVGQGGKMAVIDTEEGRIAIYHADENGKQLFPIGSFIVAKVDMGDGEMSLDRIAYALKELINPKNPAMRVDGILIDSVSPIWDDVKNYADAEGDRLNTESMSIWRKPKAKHKSVLLNLLAAPSVHIVCTARESIDTGFGKNKGTGNARPDSDKSLEHAVDLSVHMQVEGEGVITRSWNHLGHKGDRVFFDDSYIEHIVKFVNNDEDLVDAPPVGAADGVHFSGTDTGDDVAASGHREPDDTAARQPSKPPEHPMFNGKEITLARAEKAYYGGLLLALDKAGGNGKAAIHAWNSTMIKNSEFFTLVQGVLRADGQTDLNSRGILLLKGEAAWNEHDGYVRT